MKTIDIRRACFFVAILAIMANGCCVMQGNNNSNDKSKSIELLRKGVNSGRLHEAPSATWITTAADLSSVYARLGNLQVENLAIPDIDFEIYGLLLIEMGQKPTGGHGIEFDPDLSRFIENQAMVHLRWNTPKEGRVVTQVVTSPYILIKIEKTAIESIIIFDQKQNLLFEISIPDEKTK